MQNLNSITIRYKIITPLLMHGNDGKTPELREQSFKGIMRFWWRAIHGNLDLEALKKEEAKIFGNKEQKSSFRMKVSSVNLQSENFNPLPHKDSKFRINGFSPNQNFEITFLGENLNLVKNIFILSTILGEFGQRSRRGFGSIKVISVNNENFDFNYSKESINAFIKKINPNFTTKDNSENFKSFKKFPYIKSIDIGKNYSNYNDLLRKISEAIHKFSCFGSANPRFASPVYVTINKNNNQYVPIITSLNGRGCWKNFNDFKKEVL